MVIYIYIYIYSRTAIAFARGAKNSDIDFTRTMYVTVQLMFEEIKSLVQHFLSLKNFSIMYIVHCHLCIFTNNKYFIYCLVLLLYIDYDGMKVFLLSAIIYMHL